MLTNTLYRLTNEKELTIAYFGGSITEGGEENGWRRLTTKWFEQKFPGAKITEINAAIGGTGTDLGVYRCDRDVISHKPNLTFIEFAVNDSVTKSEDLSRTTEAIVRKLLASDPTMEIVFIFTITKRITDELAQGIPTAAAISIQKSPRTIVCPPSISARPSPKPPLTPKRAGSNTPMIPFIPTPQAMP